MFCVHGVLFSYAEKRLTAEAAASADAAADTILRMLEEIRSDAVLLTESTAGRNGGAPVLSSFMSMKPEISEIIAVDKNGYSWFTAGRKATPPIGADFSAEESISLPLKNGRIYTGRIKPDESANAPCMEITVPFPSPVNGETGGAVRFKASLSSMTEAAAKAAHSEIKTAVLIGGAEEMIAGRDISPSEKTMLTASARFADSEGTTASQEYIISFSQFSFENSTLTAAAYLPKSGIGSSVAPYFRYTAAVSAFLYLLAVPFIFFIIRKYRTPYEKLGIKMEKTGQLLEPAHSAPLRDKSGAEYAECFLDACEATINSLRRTAEESGRNVAEVVEKRTEHLRNEINELQRKLKEEYTKNTKKDQMMIRQSRLAAMGEMISNIAHQWRQPLNALALTIQDIEDSYRHNEINDDYIRDTVEKSMELILHMSVTIDDFRNFYKTNKDIMEFSLRRSIDEAMKIISASLKNSSIETVIDCEQDVIVRGYPNEFSQVILNILSNSKDALIDNRSADRMIRISIEATNRGGRIIIADNGGGIPANVIESVFDPYFTTKEQGRGTGIGLYMSKTIIESNMGGKIDIANTGDGTRVTIEL
ncbi:MAG: sensor histidine kinase [Deferribacterales bacterium]